MIRESGALNPYYDEAAEHADMYYESIRRRTTDCEVISKNTGFSYEQIALIKAYIFFAQHDLNAGKIRFYPSFMMAESWRRLQSKDKRHIQPHDILMLQHELQEIAFIVAGDSQDTAHVKATALYDYSTASTEFYARQGFVPR